RDQVHRPAHARHELPGDHPVGESAPGIDLEPAEHGQVQVAAADQAEGEGAVEARRARDGRDEAAAGVDEVRVLHAPRGPRAHAGQAVLGLEEDGDPAREIGGYLRGQADAQVHERALGDLAGDAPGDDLPVALDHGWRSSKWWTRTPGVRTA